MSVAVSPRHRKDILAVAARFTSCREVAAAVAINASALLAWVEAAHGEDDEHLRLSALQQHSVDQMGTEVLADDPEAFLAEAQVLYAFMTAGPGAAGAGGLP